MASRRARAVTKELTRFLELSIKKIVLDIVAELVKAPSEGGTPVDTGWARANWIPYIGSASSSPVGNRPKTGQTASTAAQSKATAEVAGSYTLSKGKIVIANNVPYIVFLNEGSSKQAPSGFVQAAIARAISG